LYAAPAQAVLVTTPFAFTILEFKDTMRKTLGMYWINTIIESVLLLRLAVELTAGIMNQIMICKNRPELF
jgi:hypothetical protein